MCGPVAGPAQVGGFVVKPEAAFHQSWPLMSILDSRLARRSRHPVAPQAQDTTCSLAAGGRDTGPGTTLQFRPVHVTENVSNPSPHQGFS